jgi:hypothetical protein
MSVQIYFLIVRDAQRGSSRKSAKEDDQKSGGRTVYKHVLLINERLKKLEREVKKHMTGRSLLRR